jgi:hypothetical protein
MNNDKDKPQGYCQRDHSINCLYSFQVHIFYMREEIASQKSFRGNPVMITKNQMIKREDQSCIKLKNIPRKIVNDMTILVFEKVFEFQKATFAELRENHGGGHKSQKENDKSIDHEPVKIGDLNWRHAHCRCAVGCAGCSC